MLRDDLQNVPVLDDFPVLVEPEDVHARVVVVTGPVLEAVQDDEVALRNGAFELDARFPGYSVCIRSK